MENLNFIAYPQLIILSVVMGLVILLIGQFKKSTFIPVGKGLIQDESESKMRKQPKAISIAIVLTIFLMMIIIGYSAFKEQGFEGVLYFLIMTLGIIAKWLWDIIKAKDSQTADTYKLILPLLISPIVFSSALSLGAGASGLALKLFSFQSGFFWQTVFGES